MGYFPALDGLRAVAVSCVLVAHASVRLLPEEWRFVGGGLGVQMFFVLSGFLITSLLLQEHVTRGAIDLRSFYIRRALRIWPLYYGTVVLYALVLPQVDDRWFSGVYVSANSPAFPAYRDSLAPYFLFLQNYAVDIVDVRLGLGILWSLAVEEQFYLLWPIILILLLKLPWRRATPVFLLGTLVLSLAARFLTLQGSLPAPTNVEWMTHTGLAGLACGSLLAWSRSADGGYELLGVRLQGGFGLSLAWGVLGLLAVSKSVWATNHGFLVRLPHLEYYEPLVVGVACAVLVERLTTSPRMGGLLCWRPLVWAGRVSFGAYMFHPLVLGLTASIINTQTKIAGLLAFSVFLAGTFALAGLSFRFVEGPILASKSRLAARRTVAIV